MSYTWISETGEKITTKSIKEFALKYGIRHSNAKSLACGHYQSWHGWTTPHPKSRRRRNRITTILLNTKTHERATIGRCLKRFSEAHELCYNELCKLVNGRKILYRGWMLERTWLATLQPIAEDFP